MKVTREILLIALFASALGVAAGGAGANDDQPRKEPTMDALYADRPGGLELANRALPGVTAPAEPGPPLEVAPGLYQSDGHSNTWLIVTDEGRIVINTGLGYEGPIHRDKFDSVSDGPIRYLIFTQGHTDHVGGTNAFLEKGTEIVAHSGNQSHQAFDEMLAGYRARHAAFAFRETFENMSAAQARVVQAQPTPTITFEDHYSLSLGGVDLELRWIPGGETNESIVVWMPQRRIAIVGNLFGALVGHVPNLATPRGDRYRDSLVFNRAIEAVRELEPEILAVGHHQPVVGAERIDRELERLHRAVAYVHDETVRYMNQGSDVYTAMAEITLPPELEVGQGYGKVTWNVRAIWESYVGWFHHLSTTELYPSPPSSAYPDLLELAGSGPLVERARLRLADGMPLEAIHLVEVVLAGEPKNVEALEIYRDAHVALERQSSNFWEISWLRNQIRLTEARLKPAR